MLVPMTTTEALQHQAPRSAEGAIDPRPLFSRAVDIAAPVIADVRLDHLDLPSPCVEFSVRQLVDHLVFVLHRVSALGRGDEAFAAGSMADLARDDGDDRDTDWAAEWRDGARAVEAAWADDAVL